MNNLLSYVPPPPRKKKIFLSYNSKDRLEFMKVITVASVNNKNPYPLRDFLSYIGYPSSIINKIMKNFKYRYIIKTFGFYNRKKYISKINFEEKIIQIKSKQNLSLLILRHYLKIINMFLIYIVCMMV